MRHLLSPVLATAIAAGTFSAQAAPFHRDSLAVPDSAKFTVSLKEYPGLRSPNPRGWYYKCANVVLAKDGALVGSWQLSDQHTSLTSWIMTARSTDGGRTWGEHTAISHRNVWEHNEVWVVPQMSVLRDGRIVMVCDLGHRRPNNDFPMLVQWQKPNRGMWNYVFWSSDHGRTWTKGEKVDNVGGEPSYILELSDGTLAFTRTVSRESTRLKNPPLPWGPNYYRNEIVFSRDRGQTWNESAILADSPFHGDCEVGLAELAPGRLLAATRIGLGNGRFGHPSRLLFSDDNGKTWPRAAPAPFYGQRTHIRRLLSGKYLVTYRNVWGTPGARALVFDPMKDLGFQPTSHILEEARCELTTEQLTIRADNGQRGAVQFNLYPAQDDDSLVDFRATLRVAEAGNNGVTISAGCWVHITPDRVFLGDRPGAGFANDARAWRDYRIRRERGTIRIFVDGQEKLAAPMRDIWVREVRFGSRGYAANQGVSHWKSISATVKNADDYSIDWSWTPAQGYPDQFRRDRIVVLDRHPDCGYSSWTQMSDGRIVIVNYTAAEREHFIQAYLVTEKDLTR